MPNLGNAWHLPDSSEPRGFAGMRSPIGPLLPGTEITICSGNQFQGAGNAANQLQDGSAVLFRRAGDASWQASPMTFLRETDNNKYFSAKIAAGTFGTGDVIEYYLRIPYSDRDTTFVHWNGASVTTASEAIAQNAPFRVTVDNPALTGQWGPVFTLPNVAIHSHLLPNGRVLMWGRRDSPNLGLDDQKCQPFVWNPADDSIAFTSVPRRADGTTVNLFCSGHTFLADGRLLVVGGHRADGDGISQTALFDHRTNQWTASEPMVTPTGTEVRRWYPTATTLPNGTVLVLSGSYVDRNQPPGKETIVVDLLQIWDNGVWTTIDKDDGAPLNFIGLPLYPRMHVVSDGRVFMSGTNDRTLLLRTVEPGSWSEVGVRGLGNRDYCPAVMYSADKILYIGGGNEDRGRAPTAGAEVIDLRANPPAWSATGKMHFPRRQHNATVLPDGTVLVTGGTRGGGGPNDGFNDLGRGQPVHAAESWDPSTGQWTQLAAEDIPRCYHSTAVLLPDGRVLSAGGGEYRPDNVNENAAEDSHRDAQIFYPPYLFKGARPQLDAAPASIGYGQTFQVATPNASEIRKVAWIALASVTHSLDHNQRCLFLAFSAAARGLDVTAPASANECPPGHYMLFIVNQAGVPAAAKIVELRPAVQQAAVAPRRARMARADAAPTSGSDRYLGVYARATSVENAAKGTAVLVGITGTCPYGIGACWGGAYEALRRMEAVELVAPVPNVADSTADVYLVDARLPPLELWERQFKSVANGSYRLRGVEVTLHGTIEALEDELFLLRDGQPRLRLTALQAARKVQWDRVARQPKPAGPEEENAYRRLLSECRQLGPERAIRVTGPLDASEARPLLQVRDFSTA